MRENVKLGQLIKEGDPARDAIHVACCPVIAGEPLNVSDELKFLYGSKEIVLRHRGSDYGDEEPIVGFPDPFLRLRPYPERYDYRDETVIFPDRIRKGDRFWMFLLPGTATGLRHHYYHPLLDGPRTCTNEHEIWLRRFSQFWGFNYDEMLRIAIQNHNNDDDDGDFDDYIVANGVDLHSPGDLGDDLRLFWEHIEGLTGQQFDQQHRDKVGWSCSC